LSSKWVQLEYEAFFSNYHIKNEKYRRLILLASCDFDRSKLPLFLKNIQIAETVKEIIPLVGGVDIQQLTREKEELKRQLSIANSEILKLQSTSISNSELRIKNEDFQKKIEALNEKLVSQKNIEEQLILANNKKFQLQPVVKKESYLETENKNLCKKIETLKYELKSSEKIKQNQDIQHEQVLVNTLKQYLSSKTMNEWEPSLLEMLKKHSPDLTANQYFANIKLQFDDLSRFLEISPEPFKEMAQSFLKQDLMSHISNPKAWGHSKHVLNVFWLGYFILNSQLLSDEAAVTKIAKTCFLTEKELENPIKSINRAWALASLFHDIGLIGEKLDHLIKNSNAILKNYPWKNSDDKIEVLKINYSMEERRDMLKNTFAKLGGLLGPFHTEVDTAFKLNLNHGVLSAVTILDRFGNDDIKGSIQTAALASAFHKIEFQANELKFSKFPIACLLKFCDEIQTWERETGLELKRDNIWFQSIVLNRLLILENQKIFIEIEYKPRNDLSPTDSKHYETEESLIESIDKYTFSALEMIDWAKSSIEIEVHFNFRGNTIRLWKNNT